MIRRFICMFFCSVFMTFMTAISCAAESRNYDRVDLSNLDLNRIGSPFNQISKTQYNLSHTGFFWNQGDNKTKGWRPQGITGILREERKFIAVSWYGRKQHRSYNNRGVRISFADVTDSNVVKYRHVLLLDKNYKPLKNMHAGGLVYRKGELHVPDTRTVPYSVRVFSINEIEEPPRDIQNKEFYNYRYVLREKRSYKVPLKPSFMSFDWDKNLVLTGTFVKCKDYHSDAETCRKKVNNKLSWYRIGEADNPVKTCGPYFSEMQGSGVFRNTVSGRRTLIIASSYGDSKASHIHLMDMGMNICDESFDHNSEYKTISYPPGLEDVHVSLNSKNIWFLTEFGPHEGRNNRAVFAIDRNHLQVNP